jgi:hypothetical protein
VLIYLHPDATNGQHAGLLSSCGKAIAKSSPAVA